jgi:nucleotide sugar dehydrogenase
VASNPEFLREGAAIEDFMKPDRVVIGVESERARDVMSGIYRPLNLIQTPMVFTNIETAEVTKYAGTAFLATKITFINEIADLCERVGADVHDVARGIGLDGRIGRKFLHPGPGLGGSCFPQYTLALAYTAREANATQTIVEQVIEVNNSRKKKMAQKVIDFCGGSVAGLTVGVLGLTFKPNTDDMRDAPSLDIVPALQAAGAKVVAFDPEGMTEAGHLLKDVTFAKTAHEAAAGADVTFFARGPHLAAMKANGIRLISEGTETVITNARFTDDQCLVQTEGRHRIGCFEFPVTERRSHHLKAVRNPLQGIGDIFQRGVRKKMKIGFLHSFVQLPVGRLCGFDVV